MLLAFLMLGGAGTPALAEFCGSPPIAPVLASADEMKQKSARDAATAKHDAFVEIRTWQSDLKTYRACLVNIVNQNKRDIATLDPVKDADKIKGVQSSAKAANHAYDATVDMEERVVNEFHAVQAAYCARTDVDKSSCPK
ncbi:MAG: hypothetical protein JO056_09755 [Alphaproteobacteria bacterium]|nr:hypothetical protein [Alphaproteobacteria bacterium]